MKKITFSLVAVALSFNAFAIENGTSVNWNEYNDFLKLYSSDKAESCSGTLIAGKYVLTAAHCLMNSRNPIAQIKNATGQEINIIAKNTHPDYYDNYNGGSGNWHDVAISELSNYVDTQQIHFFADLTKNTIKLNDNLRVFGFGRTYEELNYADFTMIDIGKELDSVYGKMIDKGNTAPGDSGGAWLKNNAIVSVHKGSKTSTHYPLETYSSISD
ncbi:trypsin-like serine protease [Aliivibrio salmonicida]|uniref:trypsin-like serine protease n=1 Tax=Aliivibrio salmonicida TaxID=40269 RepID=UPI00406D0842